MAKGIAINNAVYVLVLNKKHHESPDKRAYKLFPDCLHAIYVRIISEEASNPEVWLKRVP